MGELIIIGDRVLIRPEEGERETESGLVLPVSVTEKERVRGGQVVKVGPGYLMPNPEYSENEPWTQSSSEAVRYLPLQARPGDYALFLQKEAVELKYDNANYLIVPHSAILALERRHPEDIADGLDDLEDLFS